MNDAEFVSDSVEVVWFLGSGLGGEGQHISIGMRASLPSPKTQGGL